MSGTPVRASDCPPDPISSAQRRLGMVGAQAHPGCALCRGSDLLGLGLDFRALKSGVVVAEMDCPQALQGYPDRLHGGIISAALDAAMTNALFCAGVVAVTAELNVRFVAPVRIMQRALVRAVLDAGCAPPLYRVRAELEQGHRVVARGSAKFLAVPSMRPRGGRR